MTGNADREAVAVARQQVEWALTQGLSVHDLFAAIHLVPQWNATPADAAAHNAEKWMELTGPPPPRKKQRRLQQLWAERNPISPIVFAVCEELDLLPRDVFGEGRGRKVVEARREIVARARMLTQSSCREVADWIGLDRTTVIRHLQTADRRGRLKAIRGALRHIDHEAIAGASAERLWLRARSIGRTSGRFAERHRHDRRCAARWRAEWPLKSL